jgi:protein translocase SecG subunit
MLSVLHIIIAILLSFVITLQQRMAGLSATFGGSGTSYVQRRGAERLLFQATTILGTLFFALGVVRVWEW